MQTSLKISEVLQRLEKTQSAIAFTLISIHQLVIVYHKRNKDTNNPKIYNFHTVIVRNHMKKEKYSDPF